jgi:hypothetical protein
MSHQAACALAAPGSLRAPDDGVRSGAQPPNDQRALPAKKIRADQKRGKTEKRAAVRCMAVGFMVCALAVVAGCAVVKVPVAAGGSKSDGIVTMAFAYGALEIPQINFEQTRLTAAERCGAWGYADAQPFGARQQRCEAWDPQLGCLTYLVTMPYQCVGAK